MSIITWRSAQGISENYYMRLTELGCKSEEARGILTNDCKTELIMTGFVSDWKHFFKLRCHSTAHPDARALAIPLQDKFIELKVDFSSLVLFALAEAFGLKEKHKKKYGYKTTATKEIFIKKGAKLINKKRIIVSDNDSIKQLAAFGKVKNGYGGIIALYSPNFKFESSEPTRRKEFYSLMATLTPKHLDTRGQLIYTYCSFIIKNSEIFIFHKSEKRL